MISPDGFESTGGIQRGEDSTEKPAASPLKAATAKNSSPHSATSGLITLRAKWSVLLRHSWQRVSLPVWTYHWVQGTSSGVCSATCLFSRDQTRELTVLIALICVCSAGVGRTGCFIVIDAMMERIKHEKTVDIYGHVTLMRAQRNYMVQTEDQYVFIHDALQEAVNCGTTEVPARNLYAYIQKLTQIEGGENVTGMELEFKVQTHSQRLGSCEPIQLLVMFGLLDLLLLLFPTSISSARQYGACGFPFSSYLTHLYNLT